MTSPSVPVQQGNRETQKAPADNAAPADNVVPGQPAEVESTQSQRNAAELIVSLPADAKVYVNGNETRIGGSHRRYMSTGLIPGRSYHYEVQAVVERGGRRTVLTKSTKLTAGSSAKISFEFAETEQTDTVLTLYVPAEANVRLGGTQTEKTGSKRVFTTRRLETGNAWDDYRVRVTVNRDGQKISKEKAITLRGGEVHQLRFDFDDSLVTSN